MSWFSETFLGDTDREDEENRQRGAHEAAVQADIRARERQAEAYREGLGYLKTIPDILSRHFAPYEQAGSRSLPKLEGEYQRLLSNPNDILNNLGSGYKNSPGYKFRADEALRGIDRASAAGGTLGTPMHQRQSAELAGNLADQDYYPYLANALRLYSSGLGGLGGMAQMGYNAASTLGEDIANSTASMANLGYSHGSNEAQQMRASQAYLEQLRPRPSKSGNSEMLGGLLAMGLDAYMPGLGTASNQVFDFGGTNKSSETGGLSGILGNFSNPYRQQRSNQAYNGTYWEPRY